MAAENVLRPFQIAATGTITTDGALGVLSQSDITAPNITVGDGAHSFTLTLPDLLFSGSDLSATAGGLFFNHAAVDGGFFAAVNLGPTLNGYCVAALGQSCEFTPASEALLRLIKKADRAIETASGRSFDW